MSHLHNSVVFAIVLTALCPSDARPIHVQVWVTKGRSQRSRQLDGLNVFLL